MASIHKDNNRQYRVSVIEDQSHKHLWVFRISKYSLITRSIATLIVIVFTIFSIIAFTPIRALIPGYPDKKSRMTAIQNQILIDSLENEINKWSYYADNFKRVLNGEASLQLDSILLNTSSSTISKEDLEKYTKQDSMLIKQVDEEEKFAISKNKNRNLSIEGKHFFRPIQGLITKEYIEKVHPYIEITAPTNSMVMSCLDGTIINTSWSQESGYSIIIQHSDNIISIYRNLDKILKNIGDKVDAGSSIAFIGTNTDKGILNFELWYKGKSINPAKFI